MTRLVTFDLDGVLYRDTELTPHVIEVTEALRARGIRLTFLTNNSARNRGEVAERLRLLGITASASEVVTSGHTTALYLARCPAPGPIYVIGERGLRDELLEQGLRLTEEASQARIVVVGWDRDLTYTKLAAAHSAICNGATFVATNGDVSYPVSGGATVPGAGASVAALSASTGAAPLVIGKPAPTGLAMIGEAYDVGPAEMAAVGDRLDTDIAAANAFGCRSILVLTGISTREEAESAEGLLRPQAVIEDLSYLPSALGLDA